MENQPLVSVVILNWNGKEFLSRFLPSVVENTQIKDVEIVVADNGSSDDSVDFVHTNFPSVKVVVNDGNYGFAGGYNRALAQINARYFLLLNSDVEVTEGWLSPLIKLMESDERIAACQPKIKSFDQKTSFEYAGAAGGFLDTYGYPFCRGRIFDHCEEDKGQYDTASEIFWASGASFMVRSDLFKNLGGFDEDFFAHMEEIDFCWRLKNCGYKIVYCPESTIYHVGGGTLQKSNPKKIYLNFYNNRAMILKNEPLSSYIIKAIPREFMYMMAFLMFLGKRNWADAGAVFKANWNFITHLGKWFQLRKHVAEIRNNNKIDKNNTLGKFHNSIVFQYFILNNKRFSELKF